MGSSMDLRNFNISSFVEVLLKKFAELDSKCMEIMQQFAPEIVNYKAYETMNTGMVSDAKKRKMKTRERQAAMLEVDITKCFVEENTCYSLEFIGLRPQTQTQGESSLSASSSHAESSSGSSSHGGGVPLGVIDGYSMTNFSDIFHCLTRAPIEQKHFHKCNEITQLSTHGVVCCFIITGRCMDVDFFNVCEDLQIREISPTSDLRTYGCSVCQMEFDDIARAISAAISDEVRIISCSLGLSKLAMRPKAMLSDPLGDVTFKAFSEGILVCLPAGNQGPEFGTLNYGMPWCLHVGACNNGKILVTTIDVALKAPAKFSRVPVIWKEGDYSIIDEIRVIYYHI